MAGGEDRNDRTWIGQRPDDNTEDVSRDLDEDAERVAVTDNTSSGRDASRAADGAQPAGHREPEDER